jgi:hypothetical protein
MDVVPQLDLKLSNIRMTKCSEGRLQTFLAANKEKCFQLFCLWLTPNGYVEELTLFLLGLALLQSSRTKSSVAWLVFGRLVRRICHQWRTSAIPLKTSQPRDEIQEDLQICASQININGSTTTAIKFQLKPEARKWRSQRPWPTRPLGLIG